MGVINNLINSFMAKKKIVEDVVEESVVTEIPQEYTNEFRVYTVDGNFTSFETVEEAQAEVEANGGSITVASVK